MLTSLRQSKTMWADLKLQALCRGRERRTIREAPLEMVNSGSYARPVSVMGPANAKGERKNVLEIFRRVYCNHRILHRSDGAKRAVPGNLAIERGEDHKLPATKPDDYQRTRARGVYEHPGNDRQGQ